MLSKFKVTGVDRSGKRFTLHYDCRMTAMGINLWSGSVWEWCGNKYKLIKRV
jgi:hypothetical protein